MMELVPAQPDQGETALELRANFFRMSIYFAIGHSCAMTPLVYATSALESQAAYLGNMTLYIAMLISALVLAIPIIGMVGHRRAMVAAMALYTVYVLGFSFASMSTAPSMQRVFFISGSMCAGVAGGLLWTAEGSYMKRSAEAIAREENTAQTLVNSELATQFAFYYLLSEEVAKILWSCLMFVGMTVQTTGLLYAAFALGSCFAMTLVSELPQSKEDQPVCAKLLGTVSLWSDVRIWLLSPTNITFGLSAAYMNGYFNANIASKELGDKYIGFLTAFTVIVSWALTKVYGYFGQRFGNSIPIFVGAASFAGIPILMLATHCCQEWGWCILAFYVLQGSGRSVYESANKAVFADTFKGADSESAFANCILQMAASSAFCFFVSAEMGAPQMQIVVLLFALVTPVAYMSKLYLDPRGDEAEPLNQKSV